MANRNSSSALIPFTKQFPIQNPRQTSPQPSGTTSKILSLICTKKFPAAEAAPYVPIRQFRTPCHGIAPPVTIRIAVPVFSAPPRPPALQ
ncbi:hypothetical protein V6N13_010900 [Hibiscus sabdariffa]|uniref:Uncharacterized protein n=1 Tax=Hibiscus sabdariffa TaxID=183260 RepID=A0ABR2SAR6_9ROSI